ncbi:helix-turn-helix domain-containing protein [Natrinema sp. 1APR25-10V2]|uniref:helix-turn-helix transcriptional regulator n=1 Tax=Natrinema sp. 1APR25-10V2 TaxID=2951081 RepID=UPI0028759CF3|nr:helix-turn-helix domain-containing protein [Natrinema sp. 1APR25-10V2]MDS0476877.1 winged helix-turn-helix transcriptional regulator [Natrinema sp. 1APR25-10V2]
MIDIISVIAWIAADRVAVLGLGGLTVFGALLEVWNRFKQGEAGPATSSPCRIESVSDRERIHRLLQENEGLMKQSEIVDAVDWSKAKVSRLLSDLEENGEITKIAIGRENLISLPGHEPPAAIS